MNTHDIAQRVDPDARVAYVDNDPIVVSHARNLLAKRSGVIAVPGDMYDPERILADDDLAKLIDLAEPTCMILSGVLHFAALESARGVAAAFARAMVPGSYLIVSVGTANPPEGEIFSSTYTAAQIYIHSPEEITSFFDGLELVPPGVVAVQFWRRGAPAPDPSPRAANFIGGVALKPLPTPDVEV